MRRARTALAPVIGCVLLAGLGTPAWAEGGSGQETRDRDRACPQYRVGRISWSGDTLTRDRLLRQRIARAEGTLYKAGQIEASIRRINRLGLFEKLTKADVKAEFDDVRCIVDVTFYLKPKRSGRGAGADRNENQRVELSLLPQDGTVDEIQNGCAGVAPTRQ